MSRPSIAYCLVTLNRLPELQIALRNVSPYVDRTIVVDGGSTDGSIEWLSGNECKAMNVDLIVHKQVRLQYGNHTPIERNIYLEAAKHYDWIYVSDTDEHLQQEAARDLYSIVAEAEKQNATGIMFRAHDHWAYETGEIYDNVTNYWNPTFFKTHPYMTYSGHTHSGISRPGMREVWFKSPFEYKHIKSEKTMWRSSTFLFWTTYGEAQNNTSNPVWLAFHEMMKKYGFLDWHEFNKVMEAGTVPEEIVQWFKDHRNAANTEEAAWFIYYLVLRHPELNTEKLSSDAYPRYTWDYLERAREKRMLLNTP